MKLFETIKKVAATTAMLCLCEAAFAAQPVVWQANLTNSVAVNSVSVTSTNAPGPILWQTFSGGTSTATYSNYVDCLLAPTACLVLNGTALPNNNTNVCAGTLTAQMIGSQDLVNWYQYTNLAVTFPGGSAYGTNYNQASYLYFSAAPFRYLAITNIISSVSNASFTAGNYNASGTYTNGSFGLKLILGK